MGLSKRITIGITTALVVLLASVFLCGEKAHAQAILKPSDGFQSRIGINGLFSKQSELEGVKTLVLTKTDELIAHQTEIQAIVDQKETLAQEVDSLKEHIANLDDMFVKINRYSWDSRGNVYAWGNCTLYAKSKRPDASNSWGNANTWYRRAEAQGWNVGTKAKKGAIATTTAGRLGHVAFVEKVSLDGQWVTISEMNYTGLNRVSWRTVHYTEFRYIYELD